MVFTFVNTLSTGVTIRVRQPVRTGANASILLQTPEGLWDCVACSEWTETQYTGVNWRGLFDQDEVERLAVKNADEANFTYKSDLHDPNVSSRTKENINQCQLATTEDLFQITHSAWNPVDGSLELLMVADIKRNAMQIEGNEYTSLLLLFEKVDFETSHPVGTKRDRSG